MELKVGQFDVLIWQNRFRWIPKVKLFKCGVGILRWLDMEVEVMKRD